MSRPDLSCEVSRLQQALSTAMVRDAKDANLMSRRVRAASYEIHIRAVDLEKAVVFVSSDAAPWFSGGLLCVLGRPWLGKPCERSRADVLELAQFEESGALKLGSGSDGVCEGVEAGEHVRCCSEEIRNAAFDIRE